MSNQVDPFVIKWPKKWLADPELNPTIKYLNRFLHDGWIRSGGGDDFIANIIIRLDAIDLEIIAIKTRLDAIELRLDSIEGIIIVTAVDITIDSSLIAIQTIICTADLTVTYSATPNDKDKVTVLNDSNEVVLDGNGRLINGDATKTLRRGFEIGLDTIHSTATDKWHEV